MQNSGRLDGDDGNALDPNVVCFTFDVEWACQAVIDDVCALLDERGIRGTFFVTHAGVDVGAHERGLHPNYRRNGDVYRSLDGAPHKTDDEVYAHVLETALTFAPEALGARSHSLFFDSTMLPIYARLGLEYDASFRLELEPHLRPFWKQHGILEIPAYYADYFDLITQSTGFSARSLDLAAPGMKVFDFHPNLVYINAPDVAAHDATRPFYHDPERLFSVRASVRGTRTIFIELLDAVAAGGFPVATMGEINAAVRRRDRPRRPEPAN